MKTRRHIGNLLSKLILITIFIPPIPRPPSPLFNRLLDVFTNVIELMHYLVCTYCVVHISFYCIMHNSF